MSVERKAIEWLLSDDTGISSTAILAVCLEVDYHTGNRLYNWPYDFFDFGRCVRLMEKIPEIKEMFRRLMPFRSREWKNLVENWDRLEVMYRADEIEKLDDEISFLTRIEE